MINPTVTTNLAVISNIPIILCLNSPILSQDITEYPCSVVSAISLLSYVLTVLFRPRTSHQVSCH